ncbi:MAG: AraC family transcriptional regulator [Oscillospiraceae bacterium]|nr:AraC family transcriptional regulator [Oscillospiraceae bacterium]
MKEVIFADAKLFESLVAITPEEQAILNGSSEIDRDLYMTEGNVINARKLLDSNKLITVRKHARFIHFPEHSHDYIEMVYIAAGNVTHIINGGKITLQKGELLILNQHAKQEILPAGEGDIAVNFIILPQFFDATLSMLGNEENALRTFLVGCLQDTTNSIGYLHFRVADALPVQNLIENLIWTLANDMPDKRSINQITMGLLFLQLLGCADKLSSDDAYGNLTIKILQYVEEHYADGSLRELADSLHLSVCWLSREIGWLTGHTYKELVQAKRLSKAKFLLESTKLNVNEIAGLVGYSNFSYFHRLFLRETGRSPRKYRLDG